IKPRVAEFMEDLDKELWKLGIFAKTEHNEVAPAQHELAPIYSTTNVATDHNQLTMEIMQKIAQKHGLVCLLHEKPFAGVNGSGKHNNWSIATDEGQNLLSPGETPYENAQFLLFLCAVIKAVDDYQDLLRISVATAGNDHRLGANEAPPAVISMYLGDQLADVIEQLEHGGATSSKHANVMKIGVDTLPMLPRDATDRNRTSPFAFTGNKFEFRAPGSSHSCSGANTTLNVIVAEAFDRMAAAIEGFTGPDFHAELQKHLQGVIKEHKRIIFNGDGYAEDWLAEAARRGLPNARTTMEALRCLTQPDNVAVFEKYRVFTARELESRFEVFLEDYHRKIRIEGEVALELAETMIIPAASKVWSAMAASVRDAAAAGLDAGVKAQQERANRLGQEVEVCHSCAQALRQALGGKHEEILEALATLRASVDALEKIVPDADWPLPKYREMLFVY
ncbi:MAG: glutamine synthetase type III, partial [Planctomycetes bacterium]|nr:glutamine synthetase type III [Planctomycetota bacterium]